MASPGIRIASTPPTAGEALRLIGARQALRRRLPLGSRWHARRPFMETSRSFRPALSPIRGHTILERSSVREVVCSERSLAHSVAQGVNRIRGKQSRASVDPALVVRMERGARWSFAIVTLLLGAAWWPFLRFGWSLLEAGREGAGWSVLALSAAFYLGVFLRAFRAWRWFVEDARAGRIRRVPIRARPLIDPRSGENLTPPGPMMGWERPRADNGLWMWLALALLAGLVMSWAPWESPALRALVHDPLHILRFGEPVSAPDGREEGR